MNDNRNKNGKAKKNQKTAYEIANEIGAVKNSNNSNNANSGRNRNNTNSSNSTTQQSGMNKRKNTSKDSY